MFILLSRCAGELPTAYRIRFHLALSKFQRDHSTISEVPHADGTLLTALGGAKLYISHRGL